MALNVPDVGEAIALEAFVNKTAPQDQVLKLFKNNITPADGDTAATYTESTFTGYASVALTGASWNNVVAGSGQIVNGTQRSFTCSGASAENVYGYFLVQSASGILMWSERDASAPFAIANSGDKVQMTPAITAN